MTVQSNAILYRMPNGIPGDISRPGVSGSVEAQPFNPSLPFPAYGLPGKMVSGAFVPITASTDVVYGFLARPFPTTGVNVADPLGTSVPPTTGIANIMRRGYMTVVSNAGVPANNGPVYMRYANGTTGTPIGGLEATAVGGSNIIMSGVNGPVTTFMSAADANGNVEIAFNI